LPDEYAARSGAGESIIMQGDVPKDWMKLIPEADRATYRRGGFLSDMSLGDSAGLLVVDVTYGFTGSEGLTLEQAIDEFPTACGPASWEAMPRVSRLIALFRGLGRPVVFSRSDLETTLFAGHATKSKRRGAISPKFNEFPPAVVPGPGEWILQKTKASAFFHTPLTAYLIKQKVDTLVVCGVSTSGCVRASAVDAFSHGFTVFVVDDCCFDRSYFAHCANLFDLQAKYASVVSLHELERMVAPARASAG
jgi:maleamate amidohydrolase